MYIEERSNVNERAESVLNVLAVVLHVIGALMAILFLLISIYEMSALVKLGADIGGVDLLKVLILTFLIYVFSGLLPWAVIKVVLNMSYSLMYISDDVQEIKNRLRTKQE